MTASGILINGLWAGLFAAGLAVLLTAPHKYLIATWVCGAGGRCVRDLLIGWGVSHNWSTMVAAAVVVLAAVAITRRHRAAPVVLICAVLPLGAAVAMFNMLVALMQLSSARGEALGTASLAFTSNLAKAFTTSMAIALGSGAGVAVVRLSSRVEPVEV